MKVTITTEAFKTILSTVTPVIPPKPTLPVLATVLLRAKDGKLFLTGTNMEQSVITEAPCTVIAEGASLVNAQRILAIVRELPDCDLLVSVAGNKLTVTYPNGSANLMTMDADDFPKPQFLNEGTVLAITGEQFGALADGAGFCTAADRTRLALTGVLLEAGDGKIGMISTDGHRLAHCEIPFETLSESVTAILPLDTMTAALKLAGSHDLMSVTIGKGSIAFFYSDATLVSKLIEGSYPNWRQVMPTAHEKSFTVNCDDMARGVRRTGLMSNSVTHMLRVEFADGEAVLSAQNQDIGGEARETVKGEYTGENLVIGLNASYFADILRHVSAEQVTMEMNDAMNACVIKPVGDDSATYLIMPLRLND